MAREVGHLQPSECATRCGKQISGDENWNKP